jgi:hypothetical protein
MRVKKAKRTRINTVEHGLAELYRRLTTLSSALLTRLQIVFPFWVAVKSVSAFYGAVY